MAEFHAESNTFITDYGQVLGRVHSESACQGRACVIHHPSDHHMRRFRLLWRNDRRIFERVCPHGIGHPDPDDLAWHESQGRKGWGVHGCDGCCREPFPLPNDVESAALWKS